MADLLCIGTTGMLAPCMRALIARGDRVACIARTPASLEALGASIPPARRNQLSTHPCDYRDIGSLERTLSSIGITPEAAICWVHTPPEPVIDLVKAHFPMIDLLRVVASSAHHPLTGSAASDRTVRLGFVIEGSSSRWLTHKEISEGVYKAFISGAPRWSIGVSEPAELQPDA
ncbi:MAG: hypothetical protein JJ916_03760 [Phycisphaerales bacterium]|nr:hypothetical protein [Phycisphaerales bacterium]